MLVRCRHTWVFISADWRIWGPVRSLEEAARMALALAPKGLIPSC